MGVICSIRGRKKSRHLDKILPEQKALMKRCGMDSTGLAYELVAESSEIANHTRWRIS
jgi:hypothetical protein